MNAKNEDKIELLKVYHDDTVRCCISSHAIIEENEETLCKETCKTIATTCVCKNNTKRVIVILRNNELHFKSNSCI